MPQIQLGKTEGRVTWDEKDWLSGLNTQSNVNAFLGGSLLNASNLNPYSPLGILQPGFLAENVTGVSAVTAVLKNAVIHNTKAYAVADNALLHEIAVTTGEVTTPTTFPHMITAHGGHSTVTGEDVITYYIGATKYLFYSWKDATDGDIGRYDLATTFDDDFMSTIPASAAVLDTKNPHPLIIGDDDIMYIGDGNNVHAFDGQTGVNGTLSKNDLILPKGYIITSFAKYNNQTLVVFAYKQSSSSGNFQSEAKAFFWDYLALDPFKIVDLDDYYVTGAFSWKGTIGCFTEGSRDIFAGNKIRKLRLFNGSEFDILAEFSDSMPVNGGIQTYANHIAWNAGGKLYFYGNVFKGLDNVLNQVSAGSGTTSGLYKMFSSGVQLISSGTTTSGGLQLFANNKWIADASTYLKNAFPEFNGKKGKIKKVAVDWFGSTTGGRRISLQVIYDQAASNDIFTYLQENSYSAVSEYYNDGGGNPLPEFTKSLGIFLVWDGSTGTSTSAPRVKSITVDFDIINL